MIKNTMSRTVRRMQESSKSWVEKKYSQLTFEMVKMLYRYLANDTQYNLSSVQGTKTPRKVLSFGLSTNDGGGGLDIDH
jgi:hypothetical protein